MKRIIFCILLLVMAAALLCGCHSSAATLGSNGSKPTATPSSTNDYVLNSLPNMVQIDGRLFYLDAPLARDVMIGDAQIAGYITASNPEIPDEDGECNFAPEGTPYASWSTEEYPDTYVIYVTIANNTGWYLLRPDAA